MLESPNRDAGDGFAGSAAVASPLSRNTHPALTIAALALGTVAFGVAVDLVLPAIPTLPDVLGGTTPETQFVLALYVAGAAIGLLTCGWLADHMDRRVLFIGSLGFFAVISAACAFATNIPALVALRFLQGLVSSGPGVVTPGIVRSRFDDSAAVRIMGLLGSIQSLVPALAPIAGAWLADAYGWSSTFLVTAALAGLVFLLVASWPQLLPAGRSGGGSGAPPGTYRQLFRNASYMRQAIGFSLVLGGLVVFVFAAPVVIVKTMGWTKADFVILQVVGVSTFIATANSSSFVAARIGTETAIRIGTALALLSGLGFLAYALAGGSSPTMLIPIWIPMNIGMGLRGPPGYVAAIVAAGSNDARASALIGLFITGTMAIGTALVAPFLDFGVIAPAIAVILIIGPALVLALMPRRPEGAPAP